MNEGLILDGIVKRFGAKTVLDDVTLRVNGGEVVALVGENGAGKSTLIRIACGLTTPERGVVRVDGRVMESGDPRSASARGIGVVHQHFMLVDTLTAGENIVLGAEPRRGALGLTLDRAAIRDAVTKLGARYGLAIDPDAIVESSTVGERQRVELLAVLYRGAKYVLLDEPTAVLAPREIDALLEMIRGLARGGAGVVFVSHKLDEVLSVADRITVLRHGKVALEKPRSDASRDEIAGAVVGGDAPAMLSRGDRTNENNDDALVLEDIRADGISVDSLRVRRGEIVGVAGVEGNGQKPLLEVIAGLRVIARGRVKLGARDVTDAAVAARRDAGIGVVPEDREVSGLVPGLSVAENLALGDPIAATSSFRLFGNAARESARTWIARFSVRPDDPDAPLAALSGGNAQKVLVARELSRALVALVVAQPTRGIDLAASADVHTAILRARADGVGVLLISSDLDELRALSDRVIVLRAGTIVDSMNVADATDERLGAGMVGALRAGAAP